MNLSVAVAIASAVAFGLLSTSCATSSPRNRGSLRDAMEKARDDHEEDREVPDEPRWNDRPADDDGWRHRDRDRDREAEAEQERREDAAAAPPSLQLKNFHFGVRGGSALAEGSDIQTSFDGDLYFGAPVSDRFEVNLVAGLKVAAPEDGSDLDESVRDPIVFLRGGLEGRFFPFPKATFLSPYLLAGLGGYFMFWSFENPLLAGGVEIENDSLGGLLLSGGVGIDLVRTKRFRVGIGLIGDSYLFGEVTSQGFTNDVFGYYNSARITGEAVFRF